MADLTVPVATDRSFSSADRADRGNEPIWDVIELLFFAYRDFIGDPDDVLAKLGFGRAHHRVLHFVNRNPGMKVAELLEVLKITECRQHEQRGSISTRPGLISRLAEREPQAAPFTFRATHRSQRTRPQSTP